MDDKTIISLYQARDEQALSHTELEFGKYLTAIAQRILSNLEDAKECVNDTIFRAWNSIPPACPENLKVYLGKIARNLALDRHDQNHAKRRGGDMVCQPLDELSECLPSDAERPDTAAEQSALREAISQYLGTLPDENRRLFLQRYWYCCSIPELAENFNLNESTVKMRLLRMREALREHLGKEAWDL